MLAGMVIYFSYGRFHSRVAIASGDASRLSVD